MRSRVDPSALVGVEAALLEAFTAEWAAALSDDHPFVMATVNYGDQRLAETGLALHVLRSQIDIGKVTATLRSASPAEFWSIHAELLAGLIFHSRGFSVQHEPLGIKRGPDWIVSREGRSFAIEVKLLESSVAKRRADSRFIQVALNAARLQLPADMLPGQIDIDLTDASHTALGSLGFLKKPKHDGSGRRIDERLADMLASKVVEEVATMMKADPYTGQGRYATYRYRPLAGADHVQLAVGGHDPDPRFEFGRMLEHALDAVDQANATGLPSIVWLATRDFAATTRAIEPLWLAANSGLEEFENLGAIVTTWMLTRVSATLPYHDFVLIPGPRSAETADLASVLDRCAASHLHTCPLASNEHRYVCREGEPLV